jgi:aspartate oxidase
MNVALSATSGGGTSALRQIVEHALGLHLTREGGHAVRRIAHAADATGHAIHVVLLARARAHATITMRKRLMALRCASA